MVDTIVDKFLSESPTSTRYRRPNFAKDLKRRIVEQSFEPGASVALVARQNDINANLLFKWRQHYLDGDFGLPTVGTSPSALPTPFFLPASIVPDTPVPAVEPSAARTSSTNPRSRYAESGYCEVDFGHAQLRVLGEVSPTVLRSLIEALSHHAAKDTA
jgi:transposase